jgi:UDP-N-acetylmuramate dehydrogenase
MIITEFIPLKYLTTFKIGGLARFFAVVTTMDELHEAVTYATTRSLPLFVLGGGSNILISDEGFEGLVIKLEIKGIEKNDVDESMVEVVAGAGENWDELVAFTVAEELYGLENLSLIPGNVGAAPVQNIGAYGVEVKDMVSWVETYDTSTGEVKKLTNAQCRFSYRDSTFKRARGKKHIITRVGFLLKKNGELNTKYKDIANYIKANEVKDITLQKVRDIVVDIRTKKLPDVTEVGTAGSFFKNPIISKEKYDELMKLYPEMPSYPSASAGEVKIPAAWILDNLCGFKGFREGDVGVYKNQALVLVNFGNASAKEIQNLADRMISCVKEKTGIELEKEVNIIGEVKN